jgi:hypothetical protein
MNKKKLIQIKICIFHTENTPNIFNCYSNIINFPTSFSNFGLFVGFGLKKKSCG